VDLKTTDDASPSAFAYSVKKYRYHVQAAMYCDAVGPCEGFILIAIEKTPPYMVAVYYLNEADIQHGREEYLQDVELWKACNEANNWPQFSGEIMELKLK
jgi:exodeoxyribonuclease VIII